MNDLYADAMKWKAIAHSAEAESERNMARKYADGLFDMYKEAHEILMRKFTE